MFGRHGQTRAGSGVAPPPAAVIGAVVFLLAFGVYLYSLPPSLTWANRSFDGGDLATAVETVGVPHPPGYPTYVLLGRIFRLLPVGDTAYRLNVMSATAAAAAAAAIFFAILQLVEAVAAHRSTAAAPSGQRLDGPGLPVETQGAASVQAARGEYLPALLCALATAFAPLFWSQAIVTEVYALNALFCAVILVLLFAALKEGRLDPERLPWKVPAAALLLGVGLGNHLTVAAVAVPLLCLAIWRAPARVRMLGACLGSGLAGLMVYVYVPLAASHDPPVNWGDASSMEGFLWLITGKPYRHYLFGLPTDFWGERVLSWASLMLAQFNGLGVVLGVGGAWWLWRRDCALALCLLLTFLGVSAYATLYASGDSYVFLLPAVIVFALFAGLGARAFFSEFLLPRLETPAYRARAWQIMAGLTALLIVLVPGVAVARAYPDRGTVNLNLRADTEAADYAREALAAAAPGSIIFPHGDGPLFALWYQRHILAKDSDISVISRELLQFQWYRDGLRRREPALMLPPDVTNGREAIRALANVHFGKREIYATWDDSYLEEYALEAVGEHLFRVTTKPP